MIIGIVGKPNCGKSTFFKAATLSDVEIANYPFATIKPNSGVGFVRVECACDYFNVTCNPRSGYCTGKTRYVPVKIIDVAGLVPGAHKGKGMGFEFLDDLNKADVLIHVIDVSGKTNEKGEPLSQATHNPEEDIKFLEDELDHWYFNILKKDWAKIARRVQQTDKEITTSLTDKMSGVGASEEIIKPVLRELELTQKPVRQWSDEDLFSLCRQLRRKTKPMMIAANKIDVPGAKENLQRIRKKFPHYHIIGTSAESELALKEAAKHEIITYHAGDEEFTMKKEVTPKQQKALNFIQKNVLSNKNATGVQKTLDTAVFDVLQYIHVFPGGENNLEDKDGNTLPDCFLIPPGSTALDFAYKIHTDLGESFIKAKDVKKKLPVSKDHPLKSGDVIEIVSGK